MKLSMFYFAPIFAVVMMLEACALPTTEFKGYDGPPRTTDQLAVVRDHLVTSVSRWEDGHFELIFSEYVRGRRTIAAHYVTMRRQCLPVYTAAQTADRGCWLKMQCASASAATACHDQ